MPVTASLIVVTLAVAVVGGVYLSSRRRHPRHARSRDLSAADLLRREVGENWMDPALWVIGFPHDAPDEPFTVEQAHRAMQNHRGCDPDTCARKRAAFKTLYDAGHLVPDRRSETWVR